MSDPSRTPGLAEVLRRVMNARLMDLHVSLPGRVESYDAATQLVNVQPLIKENVFDPDTGEATPTSLPVVPNVPLMFPGAGGFRVTFPVAVGDTVLLVFVERSMDKWKSNGGEVDATDFNTHNLTDAVAIPGLHANGSPWVGADTTNMTLGKDGGAQITIKTAEVDVAGSTDAMVKGTTYRAAEDSLLTALDTLLAVLAPLTTNPAAAGAALTTYTVARTTFNAAASTYLSILAKLG